MGRRVEKKAFAYNSGSWLLTSDFWFLYDGWNLIIESSVTGQQSPVVKSYIWGLDLSQTLQGAGGIGGLIASIDTSTNKMYYYLYDANGNMWQMIDAADGSLTAHYEYDPYGNIMVESGPLAKENPFCYSTKYNDREIYLLYFEYRYYSPSLGRWISRDPIEEEIGGYNLYAYVNNNPINSIDPFGLWKAGQHRSFTTESFNKLYLDMDSKCKDKILNALLAANLSQDEGQAFKENRRHFNRDIGQSVVGKA